jgi:Ca2+-binding RTX toxin-like protein
MLLKTLSSAALALALTAAPAFAAKAELSPDGRYLDVTESTPGGVDDIVASLHRENGRQVIHLFGDVTAGTGCVRNDYGGTTECSDPELQVRVALGGGNDRFQVSESFTDITFGEGALVADLGAGDDTFLTRDTNATVVAHGGPGNDTFEGGVNADHFFGGDGDDRLEGGKAGADELRGEGGNDTLTGDWPSEHGVFADVLDGGAGIDELEDYVYSGQASSAPPIAVSLDGVANDGRAGENDNVVAVERITSSSAGSFTGDAGDNTFIAPETGAAGTLLGLAGNDTLSAGDAHGDALDGGPGDDTLEGGFGDDRIVGGPGRDIVSGDRKSRCNEWHCDLAGFGNDTIDVRDGEADSVTCGPGTDRVIADAADVVNADCETVERAAGAGGPPPAGDAPPATVSVSVKKAKLAKALKSGLTVTVTGVTGKVKLTAKRGKKTVASGAAKAKNGKATVKLKFTKAARKALKRKRTVTLKITGAGASVTYKLKR